MKTVLRFLDKLKAAFGLVAIILIADIIRRLDMNDPWLIFWGILLIINAYLLASFLTNLFSGEYLDN